MAKHHVKQHYVAKSYLAAWCDPSAPAEYEPYVWAFPAEGGEPKRRPPEKLFFEHDMYTQTIVIPGMLERRDLRIEHGLSQIENSFSRIRRDFLDQKKPIPAVPAAKLLAFVAVQQARTPGMREHVRSQWSNILETMDEMAARFENMTPEQRKRESDRPRPPSGDGPSMSHDDVRRLVNEPLQSTIVPHLRTVTPLLARLNMGLLWTDSDPGFITSDEPCVWFDPAAHERAPTFQGPALMYPTIEITMPLTPRCALLLTHRGPEGYEAAPDELVDELNRRTRAYAEKTFVSRSPVAKPIWYERGEAPSRDQPYRNSGNGMDVPI